MLKYFASNYEYDNWEKIYGTPIVDGKYQGYEVIRTSDIQLTTEVKTNKEHPFSKYK